MAASSKIYANAVVKYEESKLIGGEKLRRICDADYRDALRMVYDYGFGDGIPLESADAERLADRETEKLIAFLEEYSPDPRLTRFLLLPYLYNNLKAAYKSRFVEVDDGAYFPLFTEETEGVKSGDYSAVSAESANAAQQIDRRCESQNPTSLEVDLAFTAAEYAEGARLAKRLGRAAVKFHREKIDCTNLLSAYRLRKRGADESEFRAAFIGGGSLSYDDLVPILTKNPESALDNLDGGKFYDRARALFDTDDLVLFERETDETLFYLTAADRENMLSLSPITAYFHQKRLEIAAIKTVLTCLKNGAKDQISARVRRIYD